MTQYPHLRIKLNMMNLISLSTAKEAKNLLIMMWKKEINIDKLMYYLIIMNHRR